MTVCRRAWASELGRDLPFYLRSQSTTVFCSLVKNLAYTRSQSLVSGVLGKEKEKEEKVAAWTLGHPDSDVPTHPPLAAKTNR